jgi:hypothetical protein
MDPENDSRKIRHKFFKRLRQMELATNTSSSEKFGSIHFAALFEIVATYRRHYNPIISNELLALFNSRK